MKEEKCILDKLEELITKEERHKLSKVQCGINELGEKYCSVAVSALETDRDNDVFFVKSECGTHTVLRFRVNRDESVIIVYESWHESWQNEER